jgi:hypothetical protein
MVFVEYASREEVNVGHDIQMVRKGVTYSATS